MRRLVPALAVLAALVATALPSAAAAASTSWEAANEACGGTDPERGSGQMDGNGLLYMACSRDSGIHFNNVGIFNQSGTKIRVVPLDFGDGFTNRAADVAPSPDGSMLYVIRYDDRTVYRFARQGDGSYRILRDGWALERFPALGGAAKIFNPRGQFLATDANGDIYFATGLWSPGTDGTDDAIVKYRPDGTFVTRFGAKVAGSWALGESHGSFGGIAVTANGARVFATDVNNSRVQRFDRRDDGSYRAALAMGMTQTNDPHRWGDCWDDGRLAAPYDVALSPRGEVLVISTTCFASEEAFTYMPRGTVEVQRFDQEGHARGSITAVSTAHKRVHGIGVDRSGRIHLTQGGVVLTPAAGWSDAGADLGGGGPLGGAAPFHGGPAAPTPLPGSPDTTAPVFASATGPAATTVNTIVLSLGATDDRAVTQVRLREDGAQFGWRAYSPTLEHTLADRLGDHVLVLQLRDAAGNISAERSVTVKRVAPPVAPVAPPAPAPAPVAPKPPVVVAPSPQPTPGAGAPADSRKPTIARVVMPMQLTSGRTIRVRVFASDNKEVTQVRYSTGAGRWGAWRAVRGQQSVILPAGPGWKGVFVQVRDAAGNRSMPWFHTVLVAPRSAAWYRGTSAVDKPRLTAGTHHVDVSRFDSKVDRVSCGAGTDTVLAQANDIVASDCERVERVRMPLW